MIYYFKHKDGSLTQCGERNKAILSTSQDWQQITEAEYNAILNPPKSQEETIAEIKASYRAKRSEILNAWDIYKSNVAYGVVIEDEATHNRIVEWYQSILALDYDAIDNVPQEVDRYRGGANA